MYVPLFDVPCLFSSYKKLRYNLFFKLLVSSMTHLLVLHHCMVHHRTHSLVHHQCRPQVHHQCHPQVRITTYPQFPSCKIHSHAGFSFSPSPLPHSSPVSPPSPGNVIIVCTVCNVCYHYRVSFFHSKIPDEGDVCDTEQALVDYMHFILAQLLLFQKM